MTKLDLDSLSLSQKVGQVVMPRIDFRDSGSLVLAKKLVEEFQVGGFIIFGGDRESVNKTTSELQSISQIPLFFGCDAERGVGQIVHDMTLFPFTMSLGAIGDEGLVYEQSSVIAKEMKECGLNIVFGPVADINTNPDNPIINIRSYGDDSELVSRLSGVFIKGLQDNGIMACAKHFPGHGGTFVDSHVDMPVSEKTEEEILKCELIPFKNAADEGVTFIMPAHIAFPKISNENIPATISETLLKGLLRHKLEFEGLVVTDSFRMGGVANRGGEADISMLALKSGSDIILDPKYPETLIKKLNLMADSGNLDVTILTESVKRIIDIKNKWLTDDAESLGDNYKDGGIIADVIAERSPCLLKGGALKSDNAVICVFDVTGSGTDIARVFRTKLEETGVSCKQFDVFNEDPETVLGIVEGYQAVICLVYTTVGAWKKEAFLPESYKTILTMLKNLTNKKILVSFGSPYVVSEFMDFDTVLCTFDSMDRCQAAAAEVLKGNLQPKGKLPVKI